MLCSPSRPSPIWALSPGKTGKDASLCGVMITLRVHTARFAGSVAVDKFVTQRIRYVTLGGVDQLKGAIRGKRGEMSKAIRSCDGRAACRAEMGTRAEAIGTSQADAAPEHSISTIQQGAGAIGAPVPGVNTPRPASWWVHGRADRAVTPRPAVASPPSSAGWTLLR